MYRLHLIVWLSSFIILTLTGCGGKSKNNSLIPTSESAQGLKKESNALTRGTPSIIIFPSDALLKRLDCITRKSSQGKFYYVRDYSKSFVQDSELRFVIAAIEQEFTKKGFPLENLEQTLKLINDNVAMDEAANIAKDLRTELLNTARPDYIIELDYELIVEKNSRNLNKSLNYIVKVLDVYTNKSIASITRADIGKETDNDNVASIVKTDLPVSINELTTGITNHFRDLLANGIEISLRVAIVNSSTSTMNDECGNGEIGEKIIDWLKENSINSTFKMVKNTTTELSFTNVRIYTEDENGNSYTAYDFAKDLKKGLKSGCGLSVQNNTQSLGDALIIIE